MVVEFQPLLSYFLDGSALCPYRACRVHTSRVAPHFYCLLTLVWNVWLLELQHLVNFNMEAILINICICMKGTHTHKSQIIKILGKPPPSVRQGKVSLWAETSQLWHCLLGDLQVAAINTGWTVQNLHVYWSGNLQTERADTQRALQHTEAH